MRQTNSPAVQPDVTRPATEPEKLAVLAALFGAYPSRAPSDFRLVQRAYMQALEGVSQWGLFAAERTINQGSLDHGFLPTPSELRREIDRLVKPHLERQRRAQAEARRYAWPERLDVVQDQATRARIREGFRQLQATIPSPAGTQPPPRPPRDYSQDAIEVSDALRRTLKPGVNGGVGK